MSISIKRIWMNITDPRAGRGVNFLTHEGNASSIDTPPRTILKNVYQPPPVVSTRSISVTHIWITGNVVEYGIIILRCIIDQLPGSHNLLTSTLPPGSVTTCDLVLSQTYKTWLLDFGTILRAFGAVDSCWYIKSGATLVSLGSYMLNDLNFSVIQPPNEQSVIDKRNRSCTCT